MILLFGIPIYGIFVMRSMYKRWKQHTGKFSSKISSRAKIIICIAAYGLVAFASIYLAVGDFSSPSKVDPKPFSQLEHATFYDIDAIIEHLESSIEELGGGALRKEVLPNMYYGPAIECEYSYRKNPDKYSSYPPASAKVNIISEF